LPDHDKVRSANEKPASMQVDREKRENIRFRTDAGVSSNPNDFEVFESNLPRGKFCSTPRSTCC
jgi:hypothetical protein